MDFMIRTTSFLRQKCPFCIPSKYHSDRGIQYCSKDYVNLLQSNDIRISMTENGDPYENAVAERVNGMLKDEWIDWELYDDFAQEKYRMDEIVRVYNTIRPHLSM